MRVRDALLRLRASGPRARARLLLHAARIAAARLGLQHRRSSGFEMTGLSPRAPLPARLRREYLRIEAEYAPAPYHGPVTLRWPAVGAIGAAEAVALIRGPRRAYDCRRMTTQRSPRRRAALVAWRHHAIRQMTRSRAQTLALVGRLPADALRLPRTQGAWSIRDVLAHIAAWEAEGTRRLALIARGRGDRIVWYDTPEELDAFNARAVRAARRLGRGAILRRLAAARTRLVAALRRLPPSALVDPDHALPVTRWLREFAWTHEAEHRRAIHAWRRAARPGERS